MKKILFFIFCASLTGVGWSQGLHVSSGGTFYVSPKAHVYVENDLDVNANGDLTVTSDASNSGVLIVKGNSGSSNITYVRSIADANWHFVSAPVKTQDINDFATGAGNTNDIATSGSLYGVSVYNNSLLEGDRFVKYTTSTIATAGAFVNGKGYANKKNAAGTYTFKGTMATGPDVTITIPQYSHATYHWTLVGNPYPSFLPANNATTSLLKVNEDALFPAYTYIKVWDAANSTYKILNYASTGPDASTYISPGQGFFVDPKDNTANSFVFPVNMQAVEPTVVPTFYKSAAIPSVVVSASKGKETKSTTLKYFVNTTRGLDVGYDAGAFKEDEANDFALNTHLIEDGEGVNFTLQCLPNTDYQTSIVPLSLKVSANETLTFSAIATNLPDGLQVFLEDKVAGTITNITTTDHQVTFANSLDGVGRFYIHTASSVLSVEDATSFNTVSMYKTSNTNLRIAGLQNSGLGTINMYGITGKQVLATSFKMQSVNNIALPNNLSKGVYIVQFVSGNSKQTKKIIIE
ncbi:T9SS type A sorting domain-containing protein [Polaribacter aestuariivivens]|uniref:T9SS type A sorting domain-containing protein n=1 Tax=Polaribacter aestuariivivens TaxID=2304626 RepID=UPI003F490A97